MYEIGYVSMGNNWKKEYLTLFQDPIYRVNQLQVTETEQFERQDILLIEEESFKDFPLICQLLLEVKACKKTIIYIISSSENLDKASRIVYFQLGINGIKDSFIDLEEFSFMLRNILTKVAENHIEERTKETTLRKMLLNFDNMSLNIDNAEIYLTRLEYQVMKLLYENSGKTVSYEQVYEYIWKDKSRYKKYRVANIIFHLRKKFEKSNVSFDCIKTVRSRGYMLELE